MKDQKIGKNQKAALSSLATLGAFNSKTGGNWVFGTHSETVRLLESLRRRGLCLATASIYGVTYETKVQK